MANTDRARPGMRSLFNPLWCYHGFRMAVLGLSVFGVIMVFSSSAVSAASSGKSPFTDSLSQLVFCVLGLVVGVVVSVLPVRTYRRLAFPAVCTAIGLQLLTFTPLGVGQYGNYGWIGIGSVTFQPAEFVKLSLCMWLPSALIAARKAAAKAHGAKERFACYGVVLAVYALCLALVLGGKDLGTAMIIVFIGIVAFLVAGFPGPWLAGGVLVMSALVVALIASSPNRRDRVLAAYTQCSPSDTQAICYQSMHARYAIASGGLLGVGLGNSREKWNYLPAAHNDFIFAIIGEETGFLGSAMVILIFVILGWCLVFSALQAKDRYSAIALMCITVWLVGQALVNIGVVVGLFPVFGVPMPFVSAGGSSMLMCLMAAGFAMGLMRQQPQIRADVSRL
ncbi:FtsW/RodA/SpoVE family cell cycle protein [Bifidobacterium platyrrhinorum]|uniref:Probable peptidoglycan glycosyltransferase FtsW n=1 Tax=Bifidobacterium platyrrhinorum TaxID=2661628 RepID=A0A6L9SPK4_9BIFI|nr:FtsW/RodA/SpoVE family cell cycle protein [Bifidobacterium platyrrhinorum]NEG54384.1 cell division protein FtsW [Bifidobacterium platyrrhinorum]